jgi:hypothetical protein
MRLILRGQVDLAPETGAVCDELAECERTERVHPENRGRLLQVLHLTRALDTGLALIVSSRCVPVPPGEDPPHSIGAYLVYLSDRGTPSGSKLPRREREHYQRTIADVRNRYMHRAGAFPTRLDLDALIGESHACLSKVCRLV